MIATAGEIGEGAGARPAGHQRLVVGLGVWFTAVVVASSLLGPPLIAAFDALIPGVPPQRVLRRIAMAIALALLVVWARRLGVRRLADVGLTRDGWKSGAFARGILVGCLAVVGLFALEGLLGYRRWELDLTLLGVATALAAAPLVGLLEEATCRGLLLFPFGRLRGVGLAAAAASVSFVYATAHFARGGRALELPVDWQFGWRVWGLVPPIALAHWEAWVGLFAFGLLLYRLAAVQGHVWGVAGLHAGAVLALQVGSQATEPAMGAGTLFFANGQLPGLPLAALLLVALAGVGRTRAVTRPSRAPFRSSTAR